MKQYYATFLLVVLCLLFGQVAFSQTTINGTVSDASGGLPGAKISIKGTIAATLSDGDGNFKLSTNTPLPFTLVVSLVGMASQG